MSESHIDQRNPNKPMSAIPDDAIANAFKKSEPPETRDALEKTIEDKITKGEMPCGLYDTGICFVAVSLDKTDGDTVKFQWFDHALNISDHIED